MTLDLLIFINRCLQYSFLEKEQSSLAAFSCPLSVAGSATKDFCLSLGLLFALSESELCSEELSSSEIIYVA